MNFRTYLYLKQLIKLACETHANSVANTGVIQGEEAKPNAVPVIKGARKEGVLFFKKSKSGPFGS